VRSPRRRLRQRWDRKRAETGKCGGRLTYAERDGGPELVARAKALQGQRPRLSLRKIAAVLKSEGKTTPAGKPYSASAIASMLAN
jgi:hypothetical protein